MTSILTPCPPPAGIPQATLNVDTSPRKPQNIYQPIEEHREEDVTDADSVDSYAMAMEGTGRYIHIIHVNDTSNSVAVHG